MDETTETGREIERIYNNQLDSHDSEAEWFAMSKHGYVVESDYFKRSGLEKLREKGFEIRYSESRSAVEEEGKPLVQLHFADVREKNAEAYTE